MWYFSAKLRIFVTTTAILLLANKTLTHSIKPTLVKAYKSEKLFKICNLLMLYKLRYLVKIEKKSYTYWTYICTYIPTHMSTYVQILLVYCCFSLHVHTQIRPLLGYFLVNVLFSNIPFVYTSFMSSFITWILVV